MDVWIQTPFYSQVELPETRMAEVKEYCAKWNITLTVKIDNLKVAINKQLEDNNEVSSQKTIKIARNPWHRQRFEQPFNYTKYNRYDDVSDINTVHRNEIRM